MIPESFARSPFGTDIQADDVIENLSFFDDWEDRYRYIIDLGKQLPEMDAARKTPERIIHGCQSQVWIDHHYDTEHDRLYFEVDSDALIVRGIAGVLLSALNARSPGDIAAFDVDAYLGRIDLLGHLSPSRGNGLRSMVKRIKAVADAVG